MRRRGGRFFIFAGRQDAEILEYFQEDSAEKRKLSPSAAHCTLIVLSMQKHRRFGIWKIHAWN